MPRVIPLPDVLRVLNRGKISYVLVGAHGLASWRGKPRATEDVDVIVAAKHVKKATQLLLDAFPQLEGGVEILPRGGPTPGAEKART